MRLAASAPPPAGTAVRAGAAAADQLADQLTCARVLAGTRLVRPYSPVVLGRFAWTLWRWGTGPAGGFASLAVRNHRGFVDATVAAARLAADVLYLNVEELIRLGRAEAPLAAPARRGRTVIPTSGTTASPKGASRAEPGLGAAVSPLSRMPLRRGWRTHVAAPLFHTWGWAHLSLAMLLESTLVLRRRFDPEGCLRALTEHACDSLVVVPVTLERILRLPEETLDRYDLSRVKVVAASGSALPGDLAREWMDRFGDTLDNVYGSTEVAWATIATPAELRQAPGTAGNPPHATVVRVFDEGGREVPRGGSGRVFVGNGLLFHGCTGGGGKERIEALMSTGDVGRLDDDGRLFVEGRADDMIVSGGENVFPQEVEDCLARHGAVAEAAAVGVPDARFGQRLRAFVVLRAGASASEEDLKAHVRSSLAGFKVPREVVFVAALPRNATGKVVKRDLEHATGGAG